MKVTCTFVVVLALLGCASASDHNKAHHKRQEPDSDQALYGGNKRSSQMDEQSDAALFRNMKAHNAHRSQQTHRRAKDESDQALYGHHLRGQSDKALYGHGSFIQAEKKRQEPESDAALYGSAQEDQQSDAALYRKLAAKRLHHDQHHQARTGVDESDLALYGGHSGDQESDQALYGYGASLIQMQKKVAPTKGHLPIGVGAYQDPKAVEQRTKDDNKDCEDGKWNDCHSTYGDYGDSKKPPRSGATHAAVSFGLVALVLATMQ